MQTTILENMFFSKKRIALIALRLIGKFYTDYRVIRITLPNGTTETYEFNKPSVTIPVEPSTGTASGGYVSGFGKPEAGLLNDIEDTLYYDVLLKKVAPFDTLRERQLSIFAEVLKSNVIPAPIAAKMMLQLSEMPGKEDIIYELEEFYKGQAQAVPPDAGGTVPIQ